MRSWFARFRSAIMRSVGMAPASGAAKSGGAAQSTASGGEAAAGASQGAVVADFKDAVKKTVDPNSIR